MRKIVFIIGIGRTGSSLLSRCLAENGFSIGKNKNKDKDWQNPNGYYENDSFTFFHDELLKFNNSSWCDINNLKMNFTENHVKFYRDLIEKEFGKEELILIKDPRLTFFTEFIKEVCKDLYTPFFIFLTRDKTECVRSLSKAQNKNFKKMEKLYDITHSFKKCEFLTINHHDIIYKNPDVLNKIQNFIEIKIKICTQNLVDLNLYRERKTYYE